MDLILFLILFYNIFNKNFFFLRKILAFTYPYLEK